ncbi:uncharacterized protein LOC127804659 [Diospyros lotus]|uniref:uncharacterized protein LOC127804659 n=1 Tax=Diospyros lotus TaxID=55363 RepID=UPI00224D48B4|nr:uncharacterized protein LOC127804659 [Diospyros lotus]
MRRVMREQQDEEEDDDDCEEEQKRILYELCSMIFHILHSPPLPLSTTIIPFLNPSASSISASLSSLSSSPSAFASFFLGISLALMLFGSVTFVIGLVMLSWVVGLVFLFYFVAVFSNLSEFGLSILGHDPTQFPARKSS